MERKVEFTNCHGERLVGVLHGAVAPQMVVSCHGMFSNKDGAKHTALAQALALAGVSLLRFDFNGCGESAGTLFNLSYSRRMQDLDAALAFLGTQGVQQFALFGSSMGGAVALLSAARDERIVAIATLAAVGNPTALVEGFPDAVDAWEKQGYYDSPEGRIGREFLDDSRAHDVAAAAAVLRASILVVHGDRDDVVPCTDAHDIATAARRASLDLVLGADHTFSQPSHLRPAIERIATFLAQGLRSAIL
jgi:alpha/beta superfamily hydrolase